MFKRTLTPVWIRIVLLSGVFLLGQESWPPQQPCTDNDGDGYGNPGSAGCTYPQLDCNDSNQNIHPGVLEGPYGDPVCQDAVDNDCDGAVDDLPGGCSAWVMANLAGDSFNMGDHFAPEGDEDELPVHKLNISAFEMDFQEVTNAEYEVCVNEGACTAPQASGYHLRPWYYGNPDYKDFPVVNVNWYQARDYCAWAGKRLPTEAQWEYAARGGLDGARYPWGDEISGKDGNYWDSGDPWDNDSGPVGYYAPNGFGLYDMAGNVEEWVNDWYSPTYYQYCVDHSIETDPLGPSAGMYRVKRGGSWADDPDVLRVAYRHDLGPRGYRYTLGFRCAR